jgi:hypothetical protein
MLSQDLILTPPKYKWETLRLWPFCSVGRVIAQEGNSVLYYFRYSCSNFCICQKEYHKFNLPSYRCCTCIEGPATIQWHVSARQLAKSTHLREVSEWILKHQLWYLSTFNPSALFSPGCTLNETFKLFILFSHYYRFLNSRSCSHGRIFFLAQGVYILLLPGLAFNLSTEKCA